MAGLIFLNVQDWFRLGVLSIGFVFFSFLFLSGWKGKMGLDGLGWRLHEGSKFEFAFAGFGSFFGSAPRRDDLMLYVCRGFVLLVGDSFNS